MEIPPRDASIKCVVCGRLTLAELAGRHRSHHIVEVIPRLYLSDVAAARDPVDVAHCGITHILNVAAEAPDSIRCHGGRVQAIGDRGCAFRDTMEENLLWRVGDASRPWTRRRSLRGRRLPLTGSRRRLSHPQAWFVVPTGLRS